MRKRSDVMLLAGGALIALAAQAPAALAAGPAVLAAPVAKALDRVEVDQARHTREHRMWEIQRNLEMQEHGRRGYGPPRGYYGYRRYGPPPRYYHPRDDGPPPGHVYRYGYPDYD